VTDEKKAELEPGWYVYEANGATRWWDGSHWTSDLGKPESPWQTIVGGFVLTVIGLALVLSSTEDEAVVALIGYVIAAVGSAATLIGVIAAGVRQGARWVAWEKQQREGR
jgi:hypothetical protein